MDIQMGATGKRQGTSMINVPGAEWPVGQFGHMPEEKIFVRARRHMHF